MYSTISLAAYRQATASAAAENDNKEHSQALLPPPEGPYSAYLVLHQDEDESEEQSACCSGCSNRVRELPFPQDKCLEVLHRRSNGQSSSTKRDRVYFIPVLGQPISSNRYYVIHAERKYKGLVASCSTEEDMAEFCFCKCVKDIRPKALEPNSPYQQIQVFPKRWGKFTSECIASDGFPPMFLRKRSWSVRAKDLRGKPGRLAYVRGENPSLRAQLPPFNFSLSEKRSSIVIVGEWYCPFIFISELGNNFEDPKIQLMETPFYKMELEKFWEEIYSTEVSTAGADIFVQRTTRVQEALLVGTEAVEETTDDDGSVWMKGLMQQMGRLRGVRLSWPIIAEIRADQGRKGSGVDVRMEKLFSNIGNGIRKFACYVVVERYVLKRMDGSVVMTYSFRNCNQIEGKWE